MWTDWFIDFHSVTDVRFWRLGLVKCILKDANAKRRLCSDRKYSLRITATFVYRSKHCVLFSHFFCHFPTTSAICPRIHPVSCYYEKCQARLTTGDIAGANELTPRADRENSRTHSTLDTDTRNYFVQWYALITPFDLRWLSRQLVARMFHMVIFIKYCGWNSILLFVPMNNPQGTFEHVCLSMN